MELIHAATTIHAKRIRGSAGGLISAGLLSSVLLSPAAHSAERTCPAYGERQIEFAEVVAGDAFLVADGSEVRLAGVVAPGSDGVQWPGPAVEEAGSVLARFLEAGSLSLGLTGDERDRYGRLVAQVFVDGTWLQGELLKEGRVRAAPDENAISCTTELLAAEAEARAAIAGHWADFGFLVYSPDQLMEIGVDIAGSFQIVEGTIVTVGEFSGRYFLNFGDDYRTDFTITIAPGDVRRFRDANIELDDLEGRRVRVRGWLEHYNGPNLPISSPAALELLD